MRLVIGADHAGVKLKAPLVRWLRSAGGGKHRVLDVGTYTEDSCDYPDFAAAVGREVASGRAARGIVIDAAGIGSTMAAYASAWLDPRSPLVADAVTAFERAWVKESDQRPLGQDGNPTLDR